MHAAACNVLYMCHYRTILAVADIQAQSGAMHGPSSIYREREKPFAY